MQKSFSFFLLFFRFFSSSKISSYEKGLIKCSKEVEELYSLPFQSKNQKDREWCETTKNKYGTIIGKRW